MRHPRSEKNHALDYSLNSRGDTPIAMNSDESVDSIELMLIKKTINHCEELNLLS